MSSISDRGDYHERIAQVREYFALSQEKMAERLGASLRAYANYERGERSIPIELVRALYEQFSVDPVWLLTGNGPMILDPDVRYRLQQRVLDRVVAAVDRIENRLGKSLDANRKSRLIGLLYEQSQLLAQVAEASLDDALLTTMLRSRPRR
ncbi:MULTISPECIES: helix-turn-helix domain-containing protein [Paraburkholderia]|uniref:Helix-turn-helix transcriptional regulator n=1 Tax=Paraburkholderia phytofirmans TaxID=261302 RepID=A0ABW9BJ71_9BURK